MSAHRKQRRRAGAWLSIAVLIGSQAGCAGSGGYQEDVTRRTDDMRKGPEQGPRPSDTSFAQALRCMDNTFITYGVRDLSMLIEDLSDQTQKVRAGTKDMFISAVSQMTRRSKAVRLVAYGSVTDTTLGQFLQTQSVKPFDSIPEFSTRGSISQFDESVVKKQGDSGISLGGLSFGKANQATASVLGLDLNVIRTDDLSLVPGVTARNSVQILREGAGTDGELVFKKFGANFSQILSRSEGQAQALRTLTELAAIELLGKLTKTPYWTCLGVTDKDPGVSAEVTDWWEGFAADPQSLVLYFQNQMRARGLYRGDVDGRVNPAFIEAIRAYQQALGLPGDANLTEDFLRRYLAADHARLQAQAKPLLKEAPAEPPKAAAPPATTGKTAIVEISDPKGGARLYQPGEMYSIEVLSDKDAFMYCYLIDDANKVTQFFPNPVAPSAAVKGSVRMRFPGAMPFRFTASRKGAPETIACFASPNDLGPKVLAENAAVNDVKALEGLMKQAAGAGVGVGVLNVRQR